MDFKEYKEAAKQFAIYPKDAEHTYVSLGLAEEGGEVCGVHKKVLRDNNGEWDDNRKDKLLKELGDVTWYVAMFFEEIVNMPSMDLDLVNKAGEELDGFSLDECMGSLCGLAAACCIKPKQSVHIKENLELTLRVLEEIARRFGWTMSDVYETNIAKLTKRKEENKIHGEGSDR